MANFTTGANAQQPAGSTSWEQLNVPTLQLELLHDIDYERLNFGPQGMVSATIGAKGGPLAAPLWYWHIEAGHLIITGGPAHKVYADMHTPRLEGNILLVRLGLQGEARYTMKTRG
jgi:hypothetical protein